MLADVLRFFRDLDQGIICFVVPDLEMNKLNAIRIGF